VASFVTGDHNGTPLSGAKGYASRVAMAKKILDERQATPGSHNPKPGWTKQAGSHAAKLLGMAPTATAAQFNAATGQGYTQIINNAISELSGNPTPTVPPKPMTSLVQLYDSERNDMCLCASHDCLNTNTNYQVMWVEGYQPATGASAPNAVKLNDYWSWTASDNWADTATTAPNGYSAAVFADGYVLSETTAGASPICLQVWTNKNDHFTFGSQQALDYAQTHGYEKTSEGCIGYILTDGASRRDIYHDALLSLQAERGAGAKVLAHELLTRVEELRHHQGSDDALLPHSHQKKGGEHPARRSRSRGDSPKNAKKHFFDELDKKKSGGGKSKDSNNHHVGEENSVNRAIALLQSSL
jgi:hypothetical protein